ncbi:uncharacterized protein [Amphiura filiformis]|uniref:uncharacterized protein n=1 Tax=Amphiura filiformis TaxID=82378 RepID=UPI003B2107DD
MGIVLSQAAASRYERYNQCCGKVTGTLQLVCGVATIALGALTYPGKPLEALIYEPDQRTVGPIFTIIAGVIFFLSGVIGSATCKGNICTIRTYMALSIMSMVFALAPLVIGGYVMNKLHPHIWPPV